MEHRNSAVLVHSTWFYFLTSLHNLLLILHPTFMGPAMPSSSTSSTSDSSFPTGLVVWAKHDRVWWPARIIDRNGLRYLDTTRIWTNAGRGKRIVIFFKSGRPMQLFDVSALKEYTSHISLFNQAGHSRGAVFIAFQDANYWIHRHGLRSQKQCVRDPGFLLNSIEVTGNLAQVKKHSRNTR